MLLPRYVIFFVSFLFLSCQDNCDYFRTYKKYEPIYSSMKSLRDSVSYGVKREINSPGKLNYKGGYLFISESGKGIHVVDNRNVNTPVNIGFIVLPGNYDLATKGDYLYADSYIDLVIFDISNINAVNEVNRIEGSFENYYIDQGLYSEDSGIIIGYDEEIIEENIENHPNDTTLEYINDDKVKVLAPTEDGKIIWDNIKAVTKHPVINEDGSSTLLKVTTKSGRTIIATKAKGFMKRVNNKIVGVTGNELEIDDYIPISNVLKINEENTINKWNITEYLPKTEYLYTSEVKTALALYDCKKSIKDPWWRCNKGDVFELPYSRCDGFIEAYRGSKRTDYKPKRKFEEKDSCIYPCRVTVIKIDCFWIVSSIL